MIGIKKYVLYLLIDKVDSFGAGGLHDRASVNFFGGHVAGSEPLTGSLRHCGPYVEHDKHHGRCLSRFLPVLQNLLHPSSMSTLYLGYVEVVFLSFRPTYMMVRKAACACAASR
ncbi:hypothetical protein CONPUDRAFT_155443 [Coniophora puteana RWD-64-598 SS2]|uniref:Uncharacterized protein n=1 Tax=Coniophora puteana (strain RWD-64-598) TaxID=741705 RepID=A0A5M3MMZ7_CONPW|nr:uncharacterized protein CONPUDRAFT_155443 [Coniophora puteana RWD-64-598 SS2]EIW80075.1 hypothetical protein CONPUDRAFT_155443 [Coniophora puteana RWD-64-598 SS2]